MEFLLQYGLTNEDLEDIKARYDDAIIKNVVLNQQNVKEVINYLLEVGVNEGVIKELLENRLRR